MYNVFFQPFEAAEAFKKGSNRSFGFLLLLGSALASLALLLLGNVSAFTWAKKMFEGISFTPVTYVQYFLIFFVVAILGNLVRSFFLNLVMKIFTDKGSYLDALKVSAMHCFLISIYLLLAIIAGAIPSVGLGLAILVFGVGLIISISVAIRGLSILYKTDIVTVWVGFSVLAISAIIMVHAAFFVAGGSALRDGQLKAGKFMKPRPLMMAPGIINDYLKSEEK
jgi:hypothetical protein